MTSAALAAPPGARVEGLAHGAPTAGVQAGQVDGRRVPVRLSVGGPPPVGSNRARALDMGVAPGLRSQQDGPATIQVPSLRLRGFRNGFNRPLRRYPPDPTNAELLAWPWIVPAYPTVHEPPLLLR